MQETLERLEALYNEYVQNIDGAEAQSRNFSGFFSRVFGGQNPKEEDFNERFAQSVQAALGDLAGTQPETGQAAEVIRYMMEQPSARVCCNTAQLMLEAVQCYLIPLAEFVDAADAALLLDVYERLYRKKGLLPVQKQLRQALRARIS